MASTWNDLLDKEFRVGILRLLFIKEIVLTFQQFVKFLKYLLVAASYKCIIR
jgi:hypothetical protein